MAPREPFNALVVNFSNVKLRLAKGQVNSMVLPQPKAVFQSHISIGEVLGIATSSSDRSAVAEEFASITLAESVVETRIPKKATWDYLDLRHVALYTTTGSVSCCCH